MRENVHCFTSWGNAAQSEMNYEYMMVMARMNANWINCHDQDLRVVTLQRCSFIPTLQMVCRWSPIDTSFCLICMAPNAFEKWKMICVHLHLLSLAYKTHVKHAWGPANTLLFFLTVTMAVPPCYADLGKSAKDIFNKGYGMDACTSSNIPFSSSWK